jgi:hypothetical protein
MFVARDDRDEDGHIVPEICRELKNRINKSIKSGASSWFSARKTIALIVIAIPIIPTVINNKEINPHETIIENETTTTKTAIYNQIIGTITTLLVLYILLTLIVVANIINVSKGPLRHTK